jgi:regulator of protease activity HflC (stomatin/prohibitin superfamily)
MNIKHILLVGLAASTLGACSKVPPGNVGIKVSNFSDSGVKTVPLGVGYYWTGFGTDIYSYPTSTQNYTWTASAHEGKAIDESITFQDKNGLQLNADVAISFHVEPNLSPLLFQKYRLNMEQIIDGPLKSTIRNALNIESAQLGVEDIYGPKKAQLATATLKRVQDYFGPQGLIIEQFNWASSIRVPESVEKQIQAKLSNEQEALAAQAKVATSQAEAQQQIARAKGKAEAMQIEANAISTNPEILKLRAIEKWDGHYPVYVGGGMPLPTINTNQK